jgi:hypothetical protein
VTRNAEKSIALKTQRKIVSISIAPKGQNGMTAFEDAIFRDRALLARFPQMGSIYGGVDGGFVYIYTHTCGLGRKRGR